MSQGAQAAAGSPAIADARAMVVVRRRIIGPAVTHLLLILLSIVMIFPFVTITSAWLDPCCANDAESAHTTTAATAPARMQAVFRMSAEY